MCGWVGGWGIGIKLSTARHDTGGHITPFCDCIVTTGISKNTCMVYTNIHHTSVAHGDRAQWVQNQNRGNCAPLGITTLMPPADSGSIELSTPNVVPPSGIMHKACGAPPWHDLCSITLCVSHGRPARPTRFTLLACHGSCPRLSRLFKPGLYLCRSITKYWAPTAKLVVTSRWQCQQTTCHAVTASY